MTDTVMPLPAAGPIQPSISLGDDSPLMALDRLNSWLRADRGDYRGLGMLRGKFRPIIYWIKTHAILQESEAGAPITFRLVRDIKQCRSCGGTGTWYSYEDYNCEWPEDCRTCRKTGRVVLKFVESTIGQICWHTPRNKWVSSGLDVYIPFPVPDDDAAYEDTDWQANSPGKPMTEIEVRRDMAALLHAYPQDFAFMLDFHHHLGAMRTWGCPDIRKCQDWLTKVFALTGKD